MPDPQPRAIIALDLLRFACALMVVGFHYGAAFALAPSDAARAMLRGLPVEGGLAGFTWFGWVGVELFFVISGFVIALSAENASVAQFVRRRLLRLVPAAWICATATLLILLAAAPTPTLLQQWAMSMSFWPNEAGIDPSYWTLGIELFFYMAVATGLGARDKFAAIERRALCVGAISAGFWLVALLSGVDATALMGQRTVQLLLLPHGCCFAIGVMAWALLSRGVTRARIAALTIFTATALIEIAEHTIERTRALGVTHGPLVPMLVFLAGLAVVLACLRAQPLLARHVDAKLAATLGLMTYPLYLIHQEAGAAVTAAGMRLGLPFFPAIGVALAAALGFAWWVAIIAEPALRGVLARVSLRRGPRPDTRPSASPPTG